MAAVNTWRCESCGAAIHDSLFERAPSPFNPEDELIGCPECKGVNGFTILCDEGDCQAEASCGWPSRQGFRHTCFEHSEFSMNSVGVPAKP